MLISFVEAARRHRTRTEEGDPSCDRRRSCEPDPLRRRPEEQGRPAGAGRRHRLTCRRRAKCRPSQGIDPKTGETIERAPNENEPFSALAFKVVADPYVGRLVYFRVYSGVAKQGSMRLQQHPRRARARRPHPARCTRTAAKTSTTIDAGQIAATVGLKNTFTGDTLCDEDKPIILEAIKFPEPVISVAIEPKTKDDQERMGDALTRLVEEDPTFKARLRRGDGPDDHLRHGRAAPRDHRRPHDARVQRRGERRPARRSPTRRRSRQASKAEGRFVQQTGGRGQFGVVGAGGRSRWSAAPASCSRTRSSVARSRRSTSARSSRASERRWRPASWPATRWSTSRCSLSMGSTTL